MSNDTELPLPDDPDLAQDQPQDEDADESKSDDLNKRYGNVSA